MNEIGRRAYMLKVTTGIAMVMVMAAVLAGQAAAQPFPTNNDPSNQIRFDTPAEADARRQALINFIWDTGLPGTLPAVTLNIDSSVFSGDLDGINQSLVSRVDKLDADASGYDFHSVSYMLTPVNPAARNRVVIVHQGHSTYEGRLEGGLDTTVNSLLSRGYTVNVMQMPLQFGWNTDTDAIIPGFGYRTYGARDHSSMFVNGVRELAFRMFLEPVIQSINYIETFPELVDISMLGLSGGGWTTHLASAIDTRISMSAPVAGSAPLYHRNVNPPSAGDLEQNYIPLYDEDIAPDGSGGGVATWLEIYALGAYGTGREQVMITNQFDSCCFYGTFADSFKDIVADAVHELGAGEWSYYRETTTTQHEISGRALTRILAALSDALPTDPVAVPAPAPVALLLAGLAGLGFSRRRRASA